MKKWSDYCARRWKDDAQGDEKEDHSAVSVIETPHFLRGGDTSEATLAVLERQLRDAEPLSAEEQGMAVEVETIGASLAEPLEQIRQRVFSIP